MKKSIYILLLLPVLLIPVIGHAQNDPGISAGDTGTVTFTYLGNTVTYVTVRAADGNIWLQQNLGAVQPGISATDTSAYGHLFQWGRWDDGHQLRYSSTAATNTISPNNPSGIASGNPDFLTGSNPNDWWSAGSANDTWTNDTPATDNGLDPCAAIGPGWRLPSQPEFANEITLENITGIASGFSSNLKLTASGMRDPNTGNILNSSLYANYWTSTPSGIYAKDITILDNGVNNSDDALRSYGFSIRCLTTCTGVFPPQSILGEDTVCGNALNIFSVPPVNNANGYSWTIPSGWSIVGPATGNAIEVMTDNNSGTISVKAGNSCDSSDAIVMNVFVHASPQPIITVTGNTMSTGIYAAYQWLLNDVPIPGAQSNSYTANSSGEYKVWVTDENGCSDTSAAFQFTVGIRDIPSGGEIIMFPNPARSILHIQSPSDVQIRIYSMEGREVLKQENGKQINISRLNSGLYQVRFSDDSGRLLKTDKLTILSE